ncbi:hypothetical protein CTI12_AA584450 [Artemisia annua]|uniref:Uncharacterized protein n=1 Tax=Artemisia annua TaxID=35608 RepID=A0A2U1KMZ5_ARTAN|nr:hypothetical protein CTI12_AA584450 [Artemisia annua]
MITAGRVLNQDMYQTGITEEGGDAADQEDSFAKPSDLRRCSDFILGEAPVEDHSSTSNTQTLERTDRRSGGDKSKDDGDDSKAPVIEEITFPSVMETAKAWIIFSPVNGGISEIGFNNKTSTLSLPVINLGVNTEVYLRNLVAYEACVAAGPVVVARYTELMNGIIDTEEDAKFLRERGIVLNRLKSDKEVADLWNRMRRVLNQDMYQTGITEEGGDAADQGDSFAKPSDLRRCSDFILGEAPMEDHSSTSNTQTLERTDRRSGGDKSKDDGDDSKAPVIVEITFRSVMEMAKAWIIFSSVNGGISEIGFNNKTSTLSLPVINLGVNTEVYLRNLVAYEACVAAGPVVVARYTEIMNGIIDTEEDAKFLRERGIVLNRLKSDKEVADLWNRMSK